MRARYSWMFLLAIGALVVTLSAVRAARARAELGSALIDLHSAKSDAAELQSLRSKLGSVGQDQNATQDVLGRVTSTLRDSSLSASILKGVNPEGDTAITSPGSSSDPRSQPRLRTVSLSLEPVTPAELGTFLAAWRTHGGAWSTSRIELNKSTASTPPDAYNARIAITAILPPPTSTSSNAQQSTRGEPAPIPSTSKPETPN